MNLHARLRRLERATGPNRPAACPECGNRPGEPDVFVALPIKFDEAGKQILPDTRPRECPGCGRVLVVRLLPITIDEK